MDGFRPVSAGILTGCSWFRVALDYSRVLQMVLSGWCRMVTDGFGWFQVVSCFSSNENLTKRTSFPKGNV